MRGTSRNYGCPVCDAKWHDENSDEAAIFTLQLSEEELLDV
jgi:hypothetical protein